LAFRSSRSRDTSGRSTAAWAWSDSSRSLTRSKSKSRRQSSTTYPSLGLEQRAEEGATSQPGLHQHGAKAPQRQSRQKGAPARPPAEKPGKAAASAAGKTWRRKSVYRCQESSGFRSPAGWQSKGNGEESGFERRRASKTAKKAAASDLSQAAKKKR